MGVILCEKHGRSSFVICCRHVFDVAEAGQPFINAEHGPRGVFRWCVCPTCMELPRHPLGGIVSSLQQPRAMCYHCFQDWWLSSRPDEPLMFPPDSAGPEPGY